MYKPFGKGIPSLFVVSTPLQILNALEAIKEFEIEDYRFLIPFFENETRNQQVFFMLDYYSLPYEKYDIRKYGKIKMLADLLNSSKQNKYDRVFIGQYVDIRGKMAAFPYLKKQKGCYVYLDDGAQSYFVLRGISFLNVKDFLLNKAFSLYARFCKCNVSNFFFTSYYDVDTKKLIYPNKFHFLSRNVGFADVSPYIYFVGTNSDVYCKVRGFTTSQYYEMVDKVFNDIRNIFPEKQILYIPHGRDKNILIIDYCKQYNIIYKRLDQSIESYLIANSIIPLAIIGFTSSALINIRRIMPQTRVINYSISSGSGLNNIYKELDSYYEKNGIETRVIMLY